MPNAISAKKLLPPQRVLFTPLVSDVFVVEQFNVVQSPNDSIPAYGTPHDQISKLKPWPNHKFCLQTEPDDQGNYQRIYVADQGSQHLYNWETTDNPDWPTITQTFVVPRAGYVFPPANPATAYPPPPNTNVTSLSDYSITGIEEQRIGEPRLDSLYVAVKVTREKVTMTQARKYVDLDTNTVQTETIQKVPAGTAASAVNASGQYTDITPQNAFWSMSSTKKAQGLAGNAVLGVAQRVMYYRDNYTWPRVLNYINIQPILSNPGDIYSPAVEFSWQPVWLADAFDGPCNYTMVERWTLAKPIFGGNPNWNTTTGGSPDIPQETPMLKTEINFQGVDLSIFIPACLHSDIRIWDTQFYGSYPATTPTRWPSTILARVTISPDQGGWLTRMFYVDAPGNAGVATGISLSQTAATSTTFTLTWVIQSSVPAGTTKLDVSTDPNFASGFLSDYQNLTVPAGTSLQVIGAARGQIYYARVSRGGVTSNICICLAEPKPELSITKAGQVVSSNTYTNVGSAEVDSSVSLTLTLNSVGLLALSGFVTLPITGTDASMFSVSAMPATLPPTETFNITVQFNPTSIGTKNATLSIASNDSSSPYIVLLYGVGVSPEIQVEQPAGNILTDGSSTVDFGTVTTGSSDKVFKVSNVGNSTLRQLAVSISGTNADDYTITEELSSTELAPSEYENFTVTFNPVVDSASTETRTATLSITSSDEDENPFTVNLTGVSASPTAPGALDLTYDPNANGGILSAAVQTDGKVIVVGEFTSIVSTARNYITRLNTDGTLDAFDPNANGIVRCVAIQEDGKIIVGGDFTNIAATGRNYIARLNSDGTMDFGFNPNANGAVYSLAIKSDGDILVGGVFTTIGGGSKAYLARLNTDGTLDSGFTSEVGSVTNPGAVYGIQILNDDRVAIVGDWYDTGNTTTTTTTTTTVPPTTTTTSTTTTVPPTTTTTSTTTTVPPTTTTTSTTTTVPPTTTTTSTTTTVPPTTTTTSTTTTVPPTTTTTSTTTTVPPTTTTTSTTTTPPPTTTTPPTTTPPP